MRGGGRGGSGRHPSPHSAQGQGLQGHTLRPLSELYAMVLSVHTLSPIHGMRLSSSQASALLQASFASSLLRLPSSRPRATATGHSHVVMRPTQLIVPSLSSLAQLPLLLLLPAPIAQAFEEVSPGTDGTTYGVHESFAERPADDEKFGDAPVWARRPGRFAGRHALTVPTKADARSGRPTK